jgi:hypothetical protein
MEQNKAVQYFDYIKQQEELRKKSEELAKEMRVYADKLFSSVEGRKLANQMITAVKYFDCLPANLSDNDLRYIQAQRDFVSVFLIGLIEKQTLIEILNER